MAGLASMIVGGAALAGGIGGAIKGFKGTPDQTVTNDSTSDNTSQLQLAGKTQQQQQLEQASLADYLRGQGLLDQQESGLQDAQQYSDQAQAFNQALLSGQNMGPNPQEMQQIAAMRQAQVDMGSADVNKLLDQRLLDLNADAGQRGLRGQAYSELQGQAVRGAADSLTGITNQANLVAAQQTMTLPQQRLQFQQQAAQSGLTFADALRQQAIQNRQTYQNPALLNMMQNERVQSGVTKSSSNTTGNNTTPGQKGGFWNGVGGFFGGAAGGATTALNIGQGINNLSSGQDYRNFMAKASPAAANALSGSNGPALFGNVV